MKANDIKSCNSSVVFLPFRRLGAEMRSRLTKSCPMLLRTKPAYVILAGNDHGNTDKNDSSMITYKNPRSALVFSRSHVTINARGNITDLDKGTAYFIPEDAPSLNRKKIVHTAAAALLVILTATILFSVFYNFTSMDLPSEYLDLDFKLPAGKLYASDDKLSKTKYARLLDEHYLMLINNADTHRYYHNKRIVPFFEKILYYDGFSIETKKRAFYLLKVSAFYNNNPGILLKHRSHPLEVIRDIVEKSIKRNWGKFAAAGINVLPSAPTNLPSEYLILEHDLPDGLDSLTPLTFDDDDPADRKNQWVYAMLKKADSKYYWLNKGILPFLEAVLEEEGLKPLTKDKALYMILDFACINNRPEIIHRYRTHQDPEIRETVESCISHKPEKFSLAGIR